MTKKNYRVTFQPEGREVLVLEGTAIVEAAGQAGITLNTPCGGQGTCGKCRVIVHGDAPAPCVAGKKHLQADEISRGIRLACQMRVDRDMTVSIPAETHFFEQVILTEGRDDLPHHHEPNLIKRFMELARPDENDLKSDVDRVVDLIAETGVEAWMDVPLMRELPVLMRESDFSLTAVIDGDEVVALEAGDTSHSVLGVALDIGSTTIAGVLVDLTTGESMAMAGRTNPQIKYGDDVVGRIKFAGENTDGLKKLQRCVIDAVNEIVVELTGSKGPEPQHIYELTAVGNTTMSHLLLGVPPQSIAQAPYVSVFRKGTDLKAHSLGIEVNHNANLHLLPNVAGFVGSDTVAVAMASRIDQEEGITLAIDIGTNGELIIGNKDRLMVCSCAAGPAFEGARIRQGMSAANGAVNKVVINEGIEVGVIGGGDARGICGSGLLDAVAVLLDTGLIDPTGRILTGSKIPDNVPKKVASAVTELDGRPAVVLAENNENHGGAPVLLTQKDVRELQLAKAAIAAAFTTLTGVFGIKPEKLDLVLLAGGFGNFIRRSSAKRIGLLPNIPSKKIESIGNAALVGARRALTCRCCREQAQLFSDNMEYVELAGRQDFQQYYMEEMTFPDPNESE